jgi:metal-responsive CopG/Arc/MetJ family transcriptional regulator
MAQVMVLMDQDLTQTLDMYLASVGKRKFRSEFIERVLIEALLRDGADIPWVRARLDAIPR